MTSSTPLQRQRLTLNAYVCGLVAAAIASAMVALWLCRHNPLSRHPAIFLVFAAMTIVSEAKTMKWLRLDDGGEFTMSWAFAFSLLLLDAPAGAMIVIGLSSFVGDLAHRKPLQRAAFNASQITVSMGLAAAVMASLGHLDTIAAGRSITPLWFVAAVLAGSVLLLANTVLTCVALALHEGTSAYAMVRRGLTVSMATDGALVALAPSFVVVAQRSIALLPLALVTAVFVYRSAKLAQEREHAANHDPLTDLLNRRAFTERVDELCDPKQGPGRLVSLLLVDLDGFKGVNDRLGHHVGDMVLQEYAARLVARRQPGQIAARLGGDEFAVLLTNVAGVDDALARAQDIFELFSEPCTTVGFNLALTASVGVALWPNHGEDGEAVMQCADLAMYNAKRNRGGVQLYSDRVDHRDRGRLGLMSDLEGAISRREFVLHYQPQISVDDGSLLGAEALLRWRHPRLGLVLPGEFMPLAEHTELMGPLTDLVVEMAIADNVGWRRRGLVTSVAVNASAQNVHDLEFPKRVLGALHRAGLPSSAIEIEITENTVMTHPERTMAVLGALKAGGIRISLDDFGTGYSSLANLRNVKIDAIKIDRSFVRDVATDRDDHEIVRCIIDLANNLSLRTTAEGVETVDAWRALRSLGCAEMQGFLVAEPMTSDQFVAWAARFASGFPVPFGDRPASRPTGRPAKRPASGITHHELEALA
jgi:diguanylate cyclase (GGDEF)-like protein